MRLKLELRVVTEKLEVNEIEVVQHPTPRSCKDPEPSKKNNPFDPFGQYNRLMFG
jgi:hypothetical protein